MSQALRFSCAALIVVLSCTAVAKAETIGYWRFENSANLGEDSGPNGLDLTQSGAADYYVLPETGRGSAIDDPVPQTGADNDAAADLTGGYFHRADDPAFTLSNFTVEAYISIDEGDKYHHIAGQYVTTGDQRSWILGITSKNEVYFGVGDDGTYGAYQSHRGVTLLPEHDYYLAASFDLSASGEGNGGIKLYSKNLTLGDNLTVITTDHARTAVFDASCDFEVGAYREGMLPLDGLLDELRISDTVLSESELLVNVPEPIESILLVSGLMGLAIVARRRKRPA